MKIYKDITGLIGGTPLVEVSRYSAAAGLGGRLLVKAEYLNPAGSVKDRLALAMIEDAEARGELRPGGVIIEPTSGNTGIGLAAVAAVRGYRVILTMPESMSIERRRLLAAYGAEIVLTPASQGMSGAVARAEELAARTPDSFIPGQFENPVGPETHMRTTGEEIWRDTDGEVDIFVAGVGTGGTLTGVSRCLKGHDPAVYVAAVEPADSPLLSGGRAGAHGLQGIGANFVPAVLDRGAYDEVLCAGTEESYAAARLLARTEGLLVGITSGAALWAAGELLKRAENAGKTAVALLPDTGDRYLSTPLFGE